MDRKKRRKRGEQRRSERASESVYSRVGYGKMDYPTRRAIYHCHREREGAKERDSEERGKETERQQEDGMKSLGKDS